MYDEADLAVIRRMSLLVEAGVPASEAASAAFVEGVQPEPSQTPAKENPTVGKLLGAMLAYDERVIVSLLRRAARTLGWAQSLDDVVFPALVKLGVSWGDNQVISANEHFATEVVRREIAHAIAVTKEPPRHAPSIVLACPEDERHELGLLGLSLLLRERGIRSYYLGADVPPVDLMLAVKQTRADALCLAATLYSSRATATRAARDLVSSRLPARLFFGGPAFRDTKEAVEQTPGIGLPAGIGEAAAVIADVLAPGKEVAK
jgi:methanogenic corrinoid protein MtbC1